MEFAGLKVLVRIGKLVIRSIRAGHRSVCYDHPFLVGAFLFPIFLYISYPFLFSLLVSAAPVLVCTFALLGTLLSFGHPQFPEVEIDEKISSEISSPRAVSLENNADFKKDEMFSANDRFTEARTDVSDRGIEAASLLDDVHLVSKPKQDESMVSHSPISTWQNSREIVLEPQSVQEPKSEYEIREIESQKEIHRGKLGFEDVAPTNVSIENQHIILGVQDWNLETGMLVEGLVNGLLEEDNLESSWTPWTQMKVDHDNGGNGDGDGGDGGNDDNNDNEPLDSGSDGAESSSPDPSMADIIPLLDELYPLLENGNHKPARLSRQSSGVAADRSHKSDEGSINSDEETDHKEAEEDAGDDDDEEDVQGGTEDEARSAIKWTEDDQKNLMDLGSSEMERNQRLESLIARRRARRNMRMTMERNLIDLDGIDLPPQIAPILTTRQNPFDSPSNSYDYMGLPQIPGSAPSVLLPRHNPFDLPYDSSEEKPDLMGDSFQQEFMELNHKEPLFRRHESFSIGSSIFDFPRNESRNAGRASRFRPYFIPERIDCEETGYSSFTRQSSELSESSSFQRQFSGSSSFHRQTSGLSESSLFQRQSSDTSESKTSSAAETDPAYVDADKDEMKLNSPDFSQETRPVSKMEDVPDRIEHGSQSSDGPDSISEDEYKKRDFDLNACKIKSEVERYTCEGFHLSERRTFTEIKLGNSGSGAGEISCISEMGSLAVSEGRRGEVHQVLEPMEKKQGSGSSFSSLSEVNDDLRDEDEGLEKEGLLGPLNFSPVAEVDLNGLATAAERSNNLDYQLISEATEKKKTSTSSSSSSSSYEEYNVAKEGSEVDKELLSVHPRASEFDQRSENPADEAQEVNVHPRTSAFNERSANPSECAQEAPKICHTKDIQDPVYVEEEVYDLLSDDQHLDSVDLTLSATAERDTQDVKEHVSGQAAFSSLGSNETPKLSNEEDLLFQEPAPESVSQKLIPAPSEEFSVATDSFIVHSGNSVDKKDQSIVVGKLEEIGSIDILNHNIHVEINHSSDLSQKTIETPGVPSNKTEQKPIINFSDVSEPDKEKSEIKFPSTGIGKTDSLSELGGLIASEKLVYEEINDVKEMDEAFLSELDAVGDFSLKEVGSNLGPNSIDITGRSVDSDAPEQDPHEVGTDTRTLQPTK